MIAVVTDSTSQLTAAQAHEHRVTVVPITVSLDGEDFLEGEELSAAEFYDRLDDQVRLATSQPSPGRFLETYRRLADAGAREIVSVHVADATSGTLNSARIAAEMADLPVHLIDSKMTSYGLGVLAMHLARHTNVHGTDGLSEEADARIAELGTVFILQDLDYVLRGGRMQTPELPDGTDDIPVLGGFGGAYRLLGTGRSIDELVESMAGFLIEGDQLRHVAIAHAAPDTIAFTEGLEKRVAASRNVTSVVRYRMGPSIAVYTGPGTAGGFRWPA